MEIRVGLKYKILTKEDSYGEVCRVTDKEVTAFFDGKPDKIGSSSINSFISMLKEKTLEITYYPYKVGDWVYFLGTNPGLVTVFWTKGKVLQISEIEKNNLIFKKDTLGASNNIDQFRPAFNYEIPKLSVLKPIPTLVKIPRYVKCIKKYFIEPEQVGRIFDTELPFPNLSHCYGLNWVKVLGTMENICFEASTKEEYDNQDLNLVVSRFVKGKWYKASCLSHIKAAKFKCLELVTVGNTKYHKWYYTDAIKDGELRLDYCLSYFSNQEFNETAVECSLEEIQQYLPNDHIDKIKIKTEMGEYKFKKGDKVRYKVAYGGHPAGTIDTIRKDQISYTAWCSLPYNGNISEPCNLDKGNVELVECYNSGCAIINDIDSIINAGDKLLKRFETTEINIDVRSGFISPKSPTMGTTINTIKSRRRKTGYVSNIIRIS